MKEPLRQHRWFLYFIAPDLREFTHALKDCSKPSFKIDTTQHLLINHTVNYPKTLIWQPIEFTMVSVRADKAQKFDLPMTLMRQVETAGYANFLNIAASTPLTFGKESLNAFNDSKISIVQVDANGYLAEEWEIYNPLITSINFGSLTYENENLVDVKVTMAYDFANLVSQAQNENFNSETSLPVARRLINDEGNLIRIGTPGFLNDRNTLPKPISQNQINKQARALAGGGTGFGFTDRNYAANIPQPKK